MQREEETFETKMQNEKDHEKEEESLMESENQNKKDNEQKNFVETLEVETQSQARIGADGEVNPANPNIEEEEEEASLQFKLKAKTEPIQLVRKLIKNSRFSKEKERKRKLKKSLSLKRLQSITFEQKDLLCPICLEYICCSVTLKCGHSFCEECLQEYELLFDTCLICHSYIRNQDFRQCFLLDNIIHDFIEKNHSSELESYKQRKALVSLARQKKIISNWHIGMKIDIKDSSNVWTTGIVSRMQEKTNETPQITVCYLNSKNVQEELSVQSTRLAPLGLYTSRKDIPHYSNSSSQVSIEINTPSQKQSKKYYLS